MNIFFSTDENYVRHLAVLIFSIIENTEKKISFHVLGEEISDNSKCLIGNILKKDSNKSNIEWYDFKLYSHELESIVKNTTPKLPLLTYARLLIPNILPNLDKVLYMDVDMVVNSDISELFNYDIGNNLIAGVIDCTFKEAKTNVGLDEKSHYLNAGLLMFNLHLWRKEFIKDKIFKFIESRNGSVFYNDQGAINAIIRDRKYILPLKYNVLTPIFLLNYKKLLRYYKLKQYYNESEYENSKKNPAILHFVNFITVRPWVKGSKHPYKSKYLYYAFKTGFNVKLMKSTQTVRKKIDSTLLQYFPIEFYDFVHYILRRLK